MLERRSGAGHELISVPTFDLIVRSFDSVNDYTAQDVKYPTNESRTWLFRPFRGTGPLLPKEVGRGSYLNFSQPVELLNPLDLTIRTWQKGRSWA